ncbi:unnamed protein product [Adineta steineri]|uniref:Uncharacterized protein n=1 Tax=Adineta steineri TaxID=433720 RepID=A0A819X4M1_9BILA|nr:unnamed protein product [Adineta steineri]CAF4000819.1 unnamed protein product [Adineta steineri]CAF4133810.1 unnamed protein product [Adineta steineri]
MVNIRQHMNGTTDTCTFRNETLTDDDIEYITLNLPSTCRYLRFSSTKLSETAVSYIAENLLLRGNNFNLKSLSLYGTNLTDEGITNLCRALIDGNNHQLQSMDIELNNITDVGAREIAKMLEVNQGLKRLDISYMNIGREGIMHILTALEEKNRTLKTLDITGSISTDENINEIIQRIHERVNVINMWPNHGQ